MCASPAAHATVTPELQHAIRVATFEVVMKKPEKDPVTYEKPLPLDLLPFIERNDAYQSIGTAFALGNNTYVTAAHVIGLGIGSQYGMPALRRSDGTVFAIDRILRFSQHEDFVVFSLLNDPAPAGFAVNRQPKLDDPVLAVGNALGEGIVIRDGLYTSETAEDQDGLWKWIRFSAAASPGNSGGPLLDSDGKVIGVVIGKSPNENLNYSLPIGRVLDGDRAKARFDQRQLVALPYLHGTYTYAFKDGFGLPLTWPDFVKAVLALIARHNDEARDLLLNTYAGTLFPKGLGSEALLFDAEANGFRPRLIVQQSDGIWNAPEPTYATTDLPGDGSVSVAVAATGALVRLVRSDSAADDAFYGDSKAFMDLALKALNLRRQVGSDQVRVISLGAAQNDTIFTDPYGRKWQERVWGVPFMNFYLVALSLPTPDGYASFVVYAPSAALHEALDRGRLVAGQMDVSYIGTLAQWRSYLRRRTLLPAGLSDVKLESTPKWTLRTRRFVSSVPPDVLTISDKSQLSLIMGFMNDGPRVSWEIKEAWWNRDDRNIAAVGVWRRERPPGSAKLELRNKFASMRDRRSPYDGEITRETTEEYAVSRVLDVSGKKSGTVSSNLLYGLTLHLDGHPSRNDADRSLQALAAATSVLEPGIGDDLPAIAAAAMSIAPSTRAATDRAAIDDLSQQAVAWAKNVEALAGRDIRGRQVSDDVSEFIVKAPLDASASAGEQRERLQALSGYWKQYPAVTHNRDMWGAFLSRNHLPPDTPHEAAVLAAEAALLKALDGGAPEPAWAELARQLKETYVEERSRLVYRANLAAATYRNRISPCPAPVAETSGTRSPKYGRLTRSLDDFYPTTSRRLGEEGLVLMSLKISSTGCATGAAIVGSSGSALLDDAVLQFYETMEFIPAGMNGKAIDATVRAPIAFKLTS
ncbi:MAG: TonB family protein [Steroidobacteraceae bacterium]